MVKSRPIYLDYQATTPMDTRVLDAMMPYLTERYGNPHSADHAYGWEGEAALDLARERVASLIGAKPDKMVFLSGATEANNLAIKGTMAAIGHKRPHMVTVVSEHKCVLESALAAERTGYRVTLLPVQRDGLLDLNQVRRAVTVETALVSVMTVNNEIGVIQPIRDIAQIAREKGALFHTDAAQAFGKISLDVERDCIDLLSISGHKAYGPKGVGALFVRYKSKLIPQMSGGGQEQGLRSGTQAPALVAGLGMAAEIARQCMEEEAMRLNGLMDGLLAKLKANLPNMRVNGSLTDRWAGNLNISFPGLDGAQLLADLPGLALSSGSACSSAVSGPSYVLEALGLTKEERSAALRIGIGRYTDHEDLSNAADQIINAVEKQKVRV